MILARSWPDPFDLGVIAAYLSLVLLAVVAGYLCMAVDFRAYLRRIRGMLVIVANCLPEFPAWTREATPRCVSMFGLELPCTEADLLKAYRAQVKRLHPDRGGDRRKFLRLQSHFEEALRYLRQRNEPSGKTR